MAVGRKGEVHGKNVQAGVQFPGSQAKDLEVATQF